MALGFVLEFSMFCCVVLFFFSLFAADDLK